MKLSLNLLSELKIIVGAEGVLSSQTDLVSYSYDGSCNWQSFPDVVVFPGSAEQISGVMKLAYENYVPVTMRGAGTCISGGPIPVEGGIVLCTTRMNKILEINKENFAAHVEAGVVLNDLNMELSKHRLFFPPDPQSFLAATIGGCVSEGAGGPYAVKYGVFKHYILGMQVVLTDGTILNLGGNTMKNVTGYDLPQLICGSEGTLCAIVSVKLRLIPKPLASQTIMAAFKEVTDAGRAVHSIRSSGIIPAKIELVDNWLILRINQLGLVEIPSDAEAILLFELDGAAETMVNEAETVVRLCKQAGSGHIRAAKDAKDAEKLWTARRAAFSTIYGAAPTALAEDVVVPTDQIPLLLEKIKEIRKKYDLTIVIIGHAGDGNLHPTVLTDKNNAEHYSRAQKAVQDIFQTAIDLGGAISGEHGIGLEKKRFLSRAMQPEAVKLLKQIKQVFDPRGILNPGKIWE
jgi:glycolate oxidase